MIRTTRYWQGSRAAVPKPKAVLATASCRPGETRSGWSMYGIGRRGQYLDQAAVIDQWSKRWVV
jgi:hypothetical protein